MNIYNVYIGILELLKCVTKEHRSGGKLSGVKGTFDDNEAGEHIYIYSR